jgi:DNA polymerase-3 subunit delta
MIIKKYQFNINFEIIKKQRAILLYGINEGIKKEFIEKIKEQKKQDEIHIFFEEEILKNNQLFFEKILNNSLFAENRIIFIHQATDKIFKEIEECLGKIDQNTKIYIISSILEKKSKLRKLFEESKNDGIIPLYEDDEKTLLDYLEKELDGFKNLTTEICNLIIANSRLDRRLIQNEIIKIKSYFKDKVLKKDALEKLLNLKKESDFDEIKDCAIMGEKTKLNKLLSSNNLSKEDLFFSLNSLIFKFNKMKDLLSGKEKELEKIIDNAKPAIFWKEKPILKKQLNIWSRKDIDKIINSLNEAEILTKKNSQIESTIIFNNLLVNICKQAIS